MCESILVNDNSKDSSIRAELESWWIPALNELTTDKIVNVRIQLAVTLETFYKKFEIQSTTEEKQYKSSLCDNIILQSMV